MTQQMKDEDLTPAQATDLARYQLGPEWECAIWLRVPPLAPLVALNRIANRQTPLVALNRIANRQTPEFVGKSWRDVFRQAGAWPATRPHYSWVSQRVLSPDGETYAIAKSNRAAQRIGRALNEYDPPLPPTLTTLDLRGTAITDAGIASIKRPTLTIYR
jgi:hypothetical protein